MLFPMRKSFLGAIAGVVLICSFVGWTYAQRDADSVDPAKLLPAKSIIFLKANGSILTDEAFKKTASYQALYGSGLMQTIEDAFDAMPSQIPNEDEINGAIEHLEEHGMSLAITVDQTMQPFGVVVVHDGVGGADLLNDLAEMIPGGELDFQQVQQRGRHITMTMIPNTPVELGWWEEQGHLLIAVGIDAIHSAIAVADGDQPNLTTSPLYEKYVAADRDFTVQSVGWFDFGSLREMFGRIPIPAPVPGEPPTVDELLAIAGLDSLEHVVLHNGFKDEATWTEQLVTTSGETSGLMDLLIQETMTPDDLPPIPVGQTTMMALSFDLGKAHDTVWEMIGNASRFGPPDFEQRLRDELGEAELDLGFQLEELLDSIGHIHCLYTDVNQGWFGLGGAIAVSVDDAETLRDCLGSLADLAGRETRGEFSTRKIEKRGRTITLLRFEEAPFLTPAISVTDDWMVISLVPQAIEAFFMRVDGDLPSWEPEGELLEALQDMPDEFTSVTILDPRDSYRLLMGFLPTVVGLAELGIRESGQFPPDFKLPISPADIPPNEVMLSALFPNVMMSTFDDDGLHTYARQSLPGIPLLGGSDSMTTIAGVAVATALILPAVQQAREAARRTQSKNNLKMIGLAMFNYHDVYNHFPRGTIENEELEVEERLSWLVSILPFVDQANLYQQIDQTESWNADENAFAIEQMIPVYLNPSSAEDWADGGAATHYAGMAGVGEKAPTLPANDPKAGIFAYNRVTRIRDIRDGTSNTLAVGETEEAAPWAAGGKSTIRPLTKKPYINGGNGYGGRVGGAQFLMGDGAVRFISEDIDPDVMEALSTMAGGEVVGDF